MGGFSLGCGIGWSAPCVELLKEEHMYDISAIALIAAIFPLGAACGLPIVPFLIDKIGRKWLMLSLIPAFILGWVFIIIGVSVFALLVVGRFLTGACGGMFCVIVPMYSAEISEKQIRGTRWRNDFFFFFFIMKAERKRKERISSAHRMIFNAFGAIEVSSLCKFMAKII